MKIKGLLSIMAAAVMLSLTFASCDKALDTDSDEQQQEGSKFPKLAEAYLPDSCAGKEIAAWYSVYTENDYKSKVEAVFLFTDSAMIMTKSKTYTVEDGREPSLSVTYQGAYQTIEGDFITGKMKFIFVNGFSINVLVDDGVLSAMNTDYTKQDNSKAPKPAN